jgi:hypothetical protein
MQTLPIIRSIRNQVSDLHKRRHPAKGVVADVPGFDEAVARRSNLMKRLREHDSKMEKIMLRNRRIASNGRRFGYIQQGINNGAPLATLTVLWVDDQPGGFTITTKTGSTAYSVFDLAATQDRLDEFAADYTEGYVAFHSEMLISENFAKMGLRWPDFAKTIDTNHIAILVINDGDIKPTSAEIGRRLGVNRDDSTSFEEFMFDMVETMIAKGAAGTLFNGE